jgi:VIT1/CCC1 family predicted Fe2+/Mn2+ transporter
MTEYKFGDASGDAQENFDIKSHKGAEGKFEAGSLRGRAKRTVRYEDGIESEETAIQKTELEAKNARLNLILAYVFGVVFISVILVLTVVLPPQNRFQARVFSVVLALAAGGFGTVLSGILNARLQFGKRVTIGATGALAVFVIVYFFMPAF